MDYEWHTKVRKLLREIVGLINIIHDTNIITNNELFFSEPELGLDDILNNIVQSCIRKICFDVDIEDTTNGTLRVRLSRGIRTK